MRLHREEQVVRAICSEHYDPESNRFSTSLYAGRGTSISRLHIISLADQWVTLARTVQKFPGRKLHKLGQIGVGEIEDTGRGYTDPKMRPTPVDLTVTGDPMPLNLAHAIIPEKITDGLSRRLWVRTVVHEPPSGFDPEAVSSMV